jgi:hypothetical protein
MTKMKRRRYYDNRDAQVWLGILFLIGLFLLIVKAVYHWALANAVREHLVVWALTSTLLLPVVAYTWRKAGRDTGKDVHYQRGYRAGLLHGHDASRWQIEQLKEGSEERGAAYLKGAEKGLNFVGKMVTVRTQARQRPEPAQQNVIVLPNVTTPRFQLREPANSDEIVDL